MLQEDFQKILPKEQFSPLMCVHSAGEAQRELVNKSVDIVVINAPLKDGMGIEFAIELAQNQGCGVMMMVKNDVYEQVSYKVEEYGVLTLPRPCTAQQAFQTICYHRRHTSYICTYYRSAKQHSFRYRIRRIF